MSGMSGIEVDKGRDVFPSAVFIDSISVMGGIQKEFFNMEVREVCFHGEKRVQKRKHIMPGSSFQKRKYREITVGIGGHIYVEVVTEKIAFPMRVPSPVAVRLRVMAFAAAGRTAVFLTITDPFFPLLRSSPDRGAVTGKSQMVWMDQSFLDRTIQELLLIKPKDEKKGFSGFNGQCSSKGRSLDAILEELQGVLSPFFFPLGGFILGKRSFGERLSEPPCQMREKKS